MRHGVQDEAEDGQEGEREHVSMVDDGAWSRHGRREGRMEWAAKRDGGGAEAANVFGVARGGEGRDGRSGEGDAQGGVG